MIWNKSVATSEKLEDCSIVQSSFKELIFIFMLEIGEEMLVSAMNHCLLGWGSRGSVVAGVKGVQKF